MVDDPNTPVNEIGRPTFDNAQQMLDRLNTVLDDVLGVDVTPVMTYDAANRHLNFSFPLSGHGERNMSLAFGDLDILSSINIATGGTVGLVGSYALDLPFALDLSTQPTEDGGGIGTCTDGLDNGAPDVDTDPNTNEDDPPNVDDPTTPEVDESTIPLTDAGDPDCENAQTLEQRVLVDVSGEDELEARFGLSAFGVDASARIGMLEAGIAGANLAVASPAGESNDPAKCANNLDDDGDGDTDADDEQCQAALTLDLGETGGDGLMTIEEFLGQLGKAADPPTPADPNVDLTIESELAAAVRSTIPVGATLGVPLAGGNIVVTGDFTGPVTDALDLINDLDVDASGVRASQLFDFSPCSNDKDDDGDGVLNDGCGAVGAAEASADCTNTTDDDGDSTINDGCAAEDDPESASAALFDQIIAALRQVTGLLENTGILPAGTLDAPLPIIGSSFDDLVSFVESLEGLADATQNPGEKDLTLPDDADPCTNATDDDGDGFVNDGCDTVPGGLPESGPQCANAVSDDASATQNADAVVNDGCPAVIPSLQSLSLQLSTLLEGALDRVPGTGSAAVLAPITYDPATKDLQVDFDITLERTLQTPLTLDLPDPLGSLVALDDLDIDLVVGGHLVLGFGLGLDDFVPYITNDSELELTANASGQDIFFSAGVGSLQIQVGQETPVPENASTECADEVDSDGDGFANDGCPAKPNPEFGPAQCSDDNAGGDGKDDDGDGLADDGCGGVDPTVAGDPDGESGAECGDGDDDDFDTIADDGCGADGVPPDVPAAPNPEHDGQCTGAQDGVDDDSDGFADDGCGGSDPATAGPDHAEGAATPGPDGTGPDCAIADADPKDDDHDGFVNDGCEAKADRGRFFLGAGLTVEVTNADAKVPIASVTLDADFSGTTQPGCADVDIPNDAHTVGTPTGADLQVCAVLPLYAELDGDPNTPAIPVRDPTPADPTDPHFVTSHHVLFAIDELTDPTNVAIHFDTTALDEFIAGALMDLLLLNSGLDQLFDMLEDLLESDLLSFALPLIGGETATAASIVADLRASVKQAVADAVGAPNDSSSLTAQTSGFAEGWVTSADVKTFIDNLVADINTKLGEAGLGTTAGITATLRCGDGPNPPICDGTEDATAVSDIEFNMTIEDLEAELFSQNLDFDIGIPGLSLEATGAALRGAIPWTITFGFGISKEHGFYFSTHENGDPEIVVSPEITISEAGALDNPNDDVKPAELEGILGFIQVNLTDGGADVPELSSLSADFTVDVKDPGASPDGRLTFDELSSGPSFGDLLEFSFDATAKVNMHIETGFTGPGEGLPKLVGDLNLLWEWGVTTSEDPDDMEPGDDSDLNIQLDNVGIDAGSFVSNFLAPVFADVKRFTDPLMPVIDTVSACIPVLSDLAGECTNLIDLAEFFGLVENKDTLDTIVAIIQFVNALGAFAAEGDLVVPLKGTDLDDSTFALVGDTLREGEVSPNNVQSAFTDDLGDLGSIVDSIGAKLPEDLGSGIFPDEGAGLIAQSSGLTGILEDIHVRLPFLEQPGKLLGLLFGQDVDLIVWEPPEFSFGFSYSQKFGPIWAVPPVFVEIGGSVEFAINFGIGYDTEGFRNWLLNDQGPSALLQGLFLVDKHPLEGGADINELELRGELFANAQVSVLVFSAGAQGSIFLTIGIDLQDPNGDGRLKFNEAADIIRTTGNVLCIFNLNGQFGIRISVFAEIDLFFWSQRWEFTLANIILYEFKVECEPLPDPILAHAEGNVLILHVGSLRYLRDPDGWSTLPEVGTGKDGVQSGDTDPHNSVGWDVTAEDFKVTRIPGGVTVTAFGLTQTYVGEWTTIKGHAGDNDDKISLVDGKAEGQSQPLAFDIKADFDGDTGKDDLTGSTVGDDIVGGEGDDKISARDGDNKVWGDTKSLGAADQADDGKDVIDTGKGTDDIKAGGGDDKVSAGAGGDTIEGNDGKDQLDGGRSVPAQNGQPAAPDLADTIFGDNRSGNDPAEDTDFTGDSDTIDGGDGNDKIYPSGGADRVNGSEGDDLVVDGGGTVTCDDANTEENDVLSGGPGADDITGGSGDDIIVGGNLVAGIADTGDTKLDGGDDCDLIFGDNAEQPGQTLISVDPAIGGNDTIRGGNGGDEIHGQVGDDTINGDEPGADENPDGNAGNADGHDTVFGDEPDSAPNGADVIFGDGGNDKLHGLGGPDDMVGGLGDDDVYGYSGTDVLLGDDGSIAANDTATLTGGAGNDLVSGGPDADSLYGQGGRDDVFGDGGDDTGYGDGDGSADVGLDKNDLVRGGVGNDYLFGNNGADDIYGEQGNDRLVGGSPNGTSADSGLGAGGADNAVGRTGPATDDPTGATFSDEILGGTGTDTIAGDNATVSGTCTVTLLAEATIGEGDLLLGEAADDCIYGENGNDRIIGADGDDHAEGGDDTDTINGNDGQDDLIGGTTETADNATEGDQPDVNDIIRGDADHDVILGDNGRITRPGGSDDLDTSRGVTNVARRVIELFDVATVTDDDADVGFSGADDIKGGDGYDQAYGQGDDDVIEGNAADDHLEGNAGEDTLKGQGGQDDVIGGTGRTKSDDPSSAMDGRLDGAETIHGGDGVGGITADDFDVIMGDNATILRPDDPDLAGVQWELNTFNASIKRNVFLYDVATLTNAVDVDTHGADTIFGEADDDRLYGQGDDDTIEGDAGDDYIEGNDGADTLKGELGNDDVVGGTGRINFDPPEGVDGRLDKGETLIQGGPGFDHITGDNGIIVRVLVDGNWVRNTYNDGIQHELIRLRDIATSATLTKDALTSGGDTIEGNEDDDVIYGQGNNGLNGYPSGEHDVINGNAGDDYMEGNAGGDYMQGDDHQDDMLGGTGRLQGDPAGGVPGRADMGDYLYGGPDHDTVLGDNAVLSRPLAADGAWRVQDYGHIFDDVVGPVDQHRVVRAVINIDHGFGVASGSDVVHGNAGDDELYGQLDDTVGPFADHGGNPAPVQENCDGGPLTMPNDPFFTGEPTGPVPVAGDLLCGGIGEDAILGDQGVVTSVVEANATITLSHNGAPFITELSRWQNSLTRKVVLEEITVGGADVLLGDDPTNRVSDGVVPDGAGAHDSLHGGAGNDVATGGQGDDFLFGDDGNDALWGGDHDDHSWGGYEADWIDVVPRTTAETGISANDPITWFFFAPDDPDTVDNPATAAREAYDGYRGFDIIYGGWNQDAMQANEGDNGPVEGDRLVDWAGVHNAYYLCPATYGEYVSTRQQSPSMLTYLQQQAEADGATNVTVGPRGTGSGFDELALVYKNPDLRQNTNPPHPDTPAHFTCR